MSDGQPPAKAARMDDGDDEVDGDETETTYVNGGGVGGIKDILAYHTGNLPTMMIKVENVHQLNLKALEDWQFYVLPLAHAWWYLKSGKNATQPIYPYQLAMVNNELKTLGCKIINCSMGLHELRGSTTTEATVGSTTTTKTVTDSHPELEYYVDSNNNFQQTYYPQANDDDYLKEENPTLPVVTLTDDDKKAHDGTTTVWRPTTPFYLFNNRSVLEKEDSKTWTMSPDTSRWYKWTYTANNRLPYNAPGYKWGDPTDGIGRPAIARSSNDPTAVYFRVKQIDKSQNTVTCLLKTNMKIVVQLGYKGMYKRSYADVLHSLPLFVTKTNNIEVRHMYSWHQ